MSRLQVFVVAIALVNVAVVVEFVRRRKLGENFALLWILVGIGGMVLSVARPLFDSVARAIGVSYGPSLLFSLAMLFLLFVCMSLSLHVSRLEARTEILAEEVAFLRSSPAPTDHRDRRVDAAGNPVDLPHGP